MYIAVVLLAALVVLLFSSIAEALRDWLDPLSVTHILAVVTAAIGTLPALLLALDRDVQDAAATELAVLHEVIDLIVLVLLSTIVPAAFVFAAAAAEPSRWPSGRRRCIAAGAATGVGMSVGIVLAEAAPLLAHWRPEHWPLARAPWALRLVKHHMHRVPRAALDGPLAALLLTGAAVLATHGASGAVSLARLVAPLPRPWSGDGELSRVRTALESTQEELRAFSSVSRDGSLARTRCHFLPVPCQPTPLPAAWSATSLDPAQTLGALVPSCRPRARSDARKLRRSRSYVACGWSLAGCLPYTLVPPLAAATYSEAAQALRIPPQAYTLRGRPLGRAQRQRHEELIALQLRLQAQAARLGRSLGGCDACWRGAKVLRSLGALLLVLFAKFWGDAPTEDLKRWAARWVPCPPFALTRPALRALCICLLTTRPSRALYLPIPPFALTRPTLRAPGVSGQPRRSP